MRHPLALALAIAVAAIAAPAHAQSTATASTPVNAQNSNPFFSESDLPLHYPRFDQINDRHFGPGFDRGMAENLKEIEAIANNPEAPTFDNTILAMEKAGEILDRTSTVFFSLVGADTNDARKKLQAEYAPRLSAHSDAIALNPKLFARIKQLHDTRDTLGLDPQGVRLIERYHTSFVRSGANLSEQQKARLREINGEMAKLGTTFSQNVMAEVNASAITVDTLEQLAGLSEEQITAAAEAAKSRKLDGKYVVALQNTTGQPFEAHLQNRELRERLHKASVVRGSRGNEFDNSGIVATVVKLRAEKAAMLGHPTYAAYVLEDETAKSPHAVNEMLAKLAPAAVANARREGAAIQQMIDKEQAAKGEPTFQLQPWDWAYYTEKVRQEQFNFDESELKPYLELKNVLENGVFHAANQFY
ncbi:MAG: dipeptidyl carboxypeptidase II, partial [Lysobacter sp.]|nr:dipeptidyl carboxypeptidase II [Lysobacter sp.]